MAMLMKRFLNLTPKPTAPFSHLNYHFFSSKPSGYVFTGVADVTGEDDLVHPVPTLETMNMPNVIQARVVVYDGVCHLCHRGVKWVIKRDKDRKIKFCCLQSRGAQPYLRMSGLTIEDVRRRFLFVEGHQQYHQGSSAAIRVLSYLPLPYSALSSLAVVPAPVRNAIYDYIAARRYNWYGKSSDCLVLKEQDLPDRFIDRDEMIEKSRSTL